MKNLRPAFLNFSVLSWLHVASVWWMWLVSLSGKWPKIHKIKVHKTHIYIHKIKNEQKHFWLWLLIIKTKNKGNTQHFFWVYSQFRGFKNSSFLHWAILEMQLVLVSLLTVTNKKFLLTVKYNAINSWHLSMFPVQYEALGILLSYPVLL